MVKEKYKPADYPLFAGNKFFTQYGIDQVRMYPHHGIISLDRNGPKVMRAGAGQPHQTDLILDHSRQFIF